MTRNELIGRIEIECARPGEHEEIISKLIDAYVNDEIAMFRAYHKRDKEIIEGLKKRITESEKRE